MRKKELEPYLLRGGGWSREAKREGAKAPHKGSFLASGGTNWKGPEWRGQAPPVLCGDQDWPRMGWGSHHGEASLASLGEMLCDSGGRKRWLEQLMVPEERGLGSCQP